jgi:hypothetical protein
VRRFRALLADLLEKDYPFKHSHTALQLLEQSFAALAHELELALRASVEVRKTLAQRTLEEIYIKLPVLGLIDRSTDVIGPVEFHGPFCRIIRSALGADAKLILASDWSYSPYTFIYPDLFPGWQFVIVALPYSEAGHVLGLALAGHELGHNVWAAENIAKEFQTPIAKAILELIEGQFRELYAREVNATRPNESDTDLFGSSPPWLESLRISLKQTEELFCDFFGIAIFREAYLCSFEYLTAPASFERVPEYPSMPDRLAAQSNCATTLGVRVPDYYGNSGLIAHVEDNMLLQIADVATKRQIPALIDRVRTIASSKALDLCSDTERDRVLRGLQSRAPSVGREVRWRYPQCRLALR